MWIRFVPFADAVGRLRQMYERVKGPDDNVDNIMLAHSLRPHTLEGHMHLYKRVLHHSANQLPKWLLEAVGVYVSLLNDCRYCTEHHYAGMAGLLDDEARAEAILQALRNTDPAAVFEGRDLAALRYAHALTLNPGGVRESHIAALREAGLEDGEILELNQVAAYFAYANRTVQGLGVSTDGDILGLSPGNSDNPDDWSHRDAQQ